VMMFLLPLVSMKCFSEERNQQTLELLFTYPISDFDSVWGKFLGLVWFIFVSFVFIFSFLPYGLLKREIGRDDEKGLESVSIDFCLDRASYNIWINDGYCHAIQPSMGYNAG